MRASLTTRPAFSLMLLMLMWGFVGGCQKNRRVKFVQGDGENLHAISSFSGKTFTVKTGEKRFKGQTSRADRIEVIDDFKGINNLDSVEFEITEGLFADFDLSDFYFYGRENHDYTMEYSFTDHYVILSKIAPREDLPSQELTYAEALGDGRFRVAIAGLPISLYTIERVKDGRGKETRRDASFGKEYLYESTHFKVATSGLRFFEAPSKLDMLRADFFNTEDEWFYTKTLVGRAIDSTEILGASVAALKIKFARTNNSILGVDLNIAEDQKVLDPTKTIVALEIPVEWVDFKTAESGSDQKLVERKIEDGDAGARFWRDRQYALIDFNNADRLGKSKTQDNKLELLEIGQDYISFTIYESTTGDTYKYSLAKDNRKLEGQRLFGFDKTKFHIFSDRKSVIYGALYNQEPDFERLDFANRMYPKNNEIVFNITDNTPNDPVYQEAIENAVKAWDIAFTKADTGIRVRLGEERVALGDVRYNQIAFYGYEIDPGNLLGFGPSVQDTRTGETFSASTHIYLRSYREGIIASIRSFIRNELGLYADKALKGIPLIDKADEIVGTGTVVGRTLPDLSMQQVADFIVKTPGFDKVPQLKERMQPLAAFEPMVKPKNAKDLARMRGTAQCEFSNVASSTNNWNKIRNRCLQGNSKLEPYLNELMSSHQANPEILNLDGEQEAILDCAQNMMTDLLTSTLIHEIGHNLGLGHNFAASSDGANFAKTDKGEMIYPSSSVMDYPDRDYDLYSVVGPYDVAAIRFLYGRKVELEDGRVIDVPKNKSIEDALALKAPGGKLKPYRMCTDMENEGNAPLFDPMCLKWDLGATPAEYVTWAISKIHANIIQNGYLYNDKTFNSPRRALTYFASFKRIYEYWRYLIYNYPGIGDNYLNNLSQDKVTELLESIVAKEEAKGNLQYRQYYEATKMIYEFNRDILMQPIRICMVNTASGKIPVDFIKFRSQVFVDHAVTVQNCDQARGYLESSDLVEEPILSLEEIGDNSSPLELDLDPAVLADKIKQVYLWADYNFALNPVYSYGFDEFKSAASYVLFEKRPTMMLGVNRGFYASFMDNKSYRNEIEDLLMGRLLKGIPGEKLGLDKPLANFKEGAAVRRAILETYINSADSANDVNQTVRRAFAPTVTDNTDFLPLTTQPDVAYRLNRKGHVIFAEKSQKPNAYRILRRANGLVLANYAIYEYGSQGVSENVISVLSESLADLEKALAEDDEEAFVKGIAEVMLSHLAQYEIYLEEYQVRSLKDDVLSGTFKALKAKRAEVAARELAAADDDAATQPAPEAEAGVDTLAVLRKNVNEFIVGGFAYAYDQATLNEFNDMIQLAMDQDNLSHHLGSLYDIIE